MPACGCLSRCRVISKGTRVALGMRSCSALPREDKLKELFQPFGNITFSCVKEDTQGWKLALVNFETTEEAKKAIEEVNDKDVRTDEEKAAASGSSEATPSARTSATSLHRRLLLMWPPLRVHAVARRRWQSPGGMLACIALRGGAHQSRG